MDLPFEITDNAIQEVKKILLDKNIPKEYALRIGVKGSTGCGGANLLIGFDKKSENDVLRTIKGIDVLIDKRHFIFLAAKKIEFINSNEARGFVMV